jgi:hypothetical protein
VERSEWAPRSREFDAAWSVGGAEGEGQLTVACGPPTIVGELDHRIVHRLAIAFVSAAGASGDNQVGLKVCGALVDAQVRAVDASGVAPVVGDFGDK